MKFGGTSVANIERINAVADRVKREVDAGHEVAVVVSAMSGHTNQLVAWCSELSPMHDAREYDAVVASGEQITAGLTAIALHESRQAREESKEKEREEEPVAAKKEEKEPAAADASNPLGAMWFQFLNNLRF